MNQLKKLINKVNIQLLLVAVLARLLVAGSVYFILLLLTKSVVFALIGAFLGFVGMGFQTKIFQNKRKEAIQLIHQKVGNTEYSLDLLNIESPNIAEQLQLERLFSSNQISTPWAIDHKIVNYLLLFAISWGLYFGLNNLEFLQEKTSNFSENKKTSQEIKPTIPAFVSAELAISPPTYTGISPTHSSNMNVSAVNGSMLKWTLKFSSLQDLTVKIINNSGAELNFKNTGNQFEFSDQLISSGLYAFKALWHDSLVYQSEYYRLDAMADLAPKIEPTS